MTISRSWQTRGLGVATNSENSNSGESLSNFKNEGKTTDTSTVDPSSSRLASAGLPPGGDFSNSNPGATSNNVNFVNQGVDSRVRISEKTGQFYTAGNPGILSPLRATNGVIFPYTPLISVSYTANYSSVGLTHSNYTNYFYERSYVSDITIAGEFSVKNQSEGLYVLAVMQFFRSASKMFYGQDQLAGTPPPIVFLNAYGQYQFNNVPTVISNVTMAYPNDADYITIQTGNVASIPQPKTAKGYQSNDINGTKVPTMQTISVTLVPMYSRNLVSKQFSLGKFANGSLLSGGFI